MSYCPFEDVEGGWGQDKQCSPDSSYEMATRHIRQGFVRKVFGILTAQLALTAAVTIYFVNSAQAKLYVMRNPWTLWTAMASSFILILVLSYSERLRRAHPWNVLTLALFTVCESVLIAFASSVYDTHIVLLAVVLTCGVSLALTLFALQTKVDLTASTGLLTTLLAVLIFGSLLQFFLHVKGLHLVIIIGGVSLFSVYLVYDIQLMMGGSTYSISPDEYVFAAINLYLDILNLFLYILQILDYSRD